MSIWLFVLIILVFIFLISVLLNNFLKDKSASKIGILGIEITVLGGIVIIESRIYNLILSIVGYTMIGLGLILCIIALLKRSTD